MKTKTKKSQISNLNKTVTVAMLCAVSFVLFLLEFPIIPSAAHLKLDFSDVPALVGGLIYGPIWSVVIELFKNIIEMLIKGLGTQMGFGNIMNFIVGCAYIVPFCLLYKNISKKHSKSLACSIAAAVGIVSIVLFGIVSNYFIDPPFFKYFMGVELTKETLWPAIWSATAINAIKGVMLSVISFPIVIVVVDRLNAIIRRK